MYWYKIEYFDHDGNSIIHGCTESPIDDLIRNTEDPLFIKFINCCYYSNTVGRYLSKNSWDGIQKNESYIRKRSIVRIDPLKGDPTLHKVEGECFKDKPEAFELNIPESFASENQELIHSFVKKVTPIRESFCDEELQIPKLRVRDNSELAEYEFIFLIYGDVVLRGRFEKNNFEEFMLDELKHLIKVHRDSFQPY